MVSLGPEPLHGGQKLNWNHNIILVGETVKDPLIHFCELCELPILVYGRMLPCKHVFCFDCASKAVRQCMRCGDPVTRVERCEIGQIYLCTHGAPRHSFKACRRTYLSQRDLDAHVNHRHAQKVTEPVASTASISPQLVQQQIHHMPSRQTGNIGSNKQYSQSATSGGTQSSNISQTRTAPSASNRGNLITIQFTDAPS